VYVRERAARQLDLAKQFTPSDRRAKEAYGEAAKLASRTIEMIADSPALPPSLVTAGQVPALRILALAQLGLSELAGATLTYRKLVELDPRAADAVRSSADDLAARALAADEFRQAADLAEFSLKLQPNQTGALKTLALARLFLGESSTAAEISLNLNRLYPTAGSELAKTLQETGQRALLAGKYSDAIRFLNLSLTLKPDDSTRRAVADALFGYGDFSTAAETYRSLLTEQSPDLELVRRWTDALAHV
jgi:tetratricopeptide (TPR) repeat protein